MREEKHPDMDRYSIWGSSAGGHLVASFGAEKTGVPYKFMEFPGVGHGVGLDIGGVSEAWFEEAVNFWLSAGHPE